MQIFVYLLDHGVPVNQPGKNGFPPLVYVARGDKGESPLKVKTLLENGARVNAANREGKTALHYAAAASHLDVMAVLLDNGADPSIKDHKGETALSLAHLSGKTEAAALLLRRGAQR
jgi:ankyrin repeat protein